jgi:hypothetical protein
MSLCEILAVVQVACSSLAIVLACVALYLSSR